MDKNPHGKMMKKSATEYATSSSLSDLEKKENPSNTPLISFQLLKEYGDLMHSNQGERLIDPRFTPSSSSGSQVLTTNDIMRMASSRVLQCPSKSMDFASILINGFFDDNNSETYSEDLELAMLLHASALKFHNRQFDRARKLLNVCRESSSLSGNPVQKVVFFFADALQRRIRRELGIVPSEDSEGNPWTNGMAAVRGAPTIFQIVQVEKYLPFCTIAEYTAMQSVLDNIASAKRVHLVDLGFQRSGSHWTIMMQGLQSLANKYGIPLEMLKLTAIGTSKENMEEIGKYLSISAEAMKIPFQFKTIVSELYNLKKDMFEIEPDEVLVVHSELRLSSLLAWPDRLENLLQTIANLHPCALITTELDANTNASEFIDRFHEAVTLASAVFDCVDNCVNRDHPCRALIEQVVVREAIENIITAEGEERIHRQQRIGVWRAMMERCGLVEVPVSSSAFCQAKMLVKNNPTWNGCSLDSDGKCMLIGWRGNPIKSVSVWKFQHGNH